MKYTLKTVNCTRLTHAELDEMIARQITDLGNMPPSVDDVDNTFPNYLNDLSVKLSLFQKALQQIQANSATQSIVKGEGERNQASMHLKKTINAAALSDVPAEHEAAFQLKLLMKKYKGIERQDFDSQTSKTDLMIADLEGRVYAAHMATLGLQRYLTRLKKANNDFKIIIAGRSESKATTITYNAHALRHDLMDCYKEFTLFVQAMANVPNANYYVQRLALINVTRKDFADRMAQRKGVALSNAEKAAGTAVAN